MQRYPRQSYLNFTVTSSICFSFGLSCSAAVELSADTGISPTSTFATWSYIQEFFPLKSINMTFLSTWYRLLEFGLQAIFT